MQITRLCRHGSTWSVICAPDHSSLSRSTCTSVCLLYQGHQARVHCLSFVIFLLSTKQQLDGVGKIHGHVLPTMLQGFCRLWKMEGHQPLPGSLDDLSSMPQVFQNAQTIPLIWHPACAALYILTSIGTCHIQSISCAQMHLSFLLLLVLCHQQRKVKLIFI